MYILLPTLIVASAGVCIWFAMRIIRDHGREQEPTADQGDLFRLLRKLGIGAAILSFLFSAGLGTWVTVMLVSGGNRDSFFYWCAIRCVLFFVAGLAMLKLGSTGSFAERK